MSYYGCIVTYKETDLATIQKATGYPVDIAVEVKIGRQMGKFVNSPHALIEYLRSIQKIK